MHMKERATYRCKSKRCRASTGLPGIKSTINGKASDAKTSDDSDKSRAHSQKRPSTTSHKPLSTASKKRPRTISKHEGSTNLMSQTLLTVASKLEQVFNNSGTPHHKVKRVYVIKFDDKNLNSKTRHKKYTRVLYERKIGEEGNSENMNRAASRSRNRARYPTTASDEERAQSISTSGDRSGDTQDTSPGHSIIADENDFERDACLRKRYEKDYDKTEIQRSSRPRENLHSEFGKSLQNWQVCNDKEPNHKVFGREHAKRNPKTDQIAEIFGAILKEIENLSPKKEGRAKSPKKKTLGEVIESDQSLVSADYTIPPSMVNKEAVDVLQALIDHKRKPQKRFRHRRKPHRSCQRLGSLGQSFSSTEWYGLRQPLNYQAEVISELDACNVAASSSAGSGPLCRICHERQGTLVRPCRCRGSMAYVHVECLQTWLTEKEIDYCEVCHYVFRVIHVPEYRLIPSIGFWYKFAATNEQRKRILIDITLAVLFLPVLIFVTLFARSCAAEYPADDLEEDVEYLEISWTGLGWLLLVYALRFFTFLLNTFYVGTVLVRVNHHLGTWLSWYVNKNVTVVLEDRHPGSLRSVGTGDEINRTISE